MPPPQPKPRRLSTTTGVTIGLAGTLLGFLILLLVPYLGNVYLQVLILLGSFALLTYFSHCLAHFIVGRVVGLKFGHYVFGGSSITKTSSQTIRSLDHLFPRLGIRLTRESRKNATHSQRSIMFASGVTASTLLPLIPTIISFTTLPGPLEVLMPILWIGYLAFGIYFSPRFGDLSRIQPPA